MCYLPVWVLLSSVSQFVASCLCWKVCKLLQLQSLEYLRVEEAPAQAPGHLHRHVRRALKRLFISCLALDNK